MSKPLEVAPWRAELHENRRQTDIATYRLNQPWGRFCKKNNITLGEQKTFHNTFVHHFWTTLLDVTFGRNF